MADRGNLVSADPTNCYHTALLILWCPKLFYEKINDGTLLDVTCSDHRLVASSSTSIPITTATDSRACDMHVTGIPVFYLTYIDSQHNLII